MKKKKFLTLVATGLMACLVAAMGGMTYSKYITSTSTDKQQATAAKWGFVMTANTENLFGKMYNNTNKEAGKPATDGKSATIVKTTAEGISVEANNNNDKLIVAPGTTGSMTIAIDGTAEVRAELKLTAGATLSEICLKKYNNNAVDYYPITWTLKGGDLDKSGTLEYVLTELAKTSQIIEANTSYSKNYTLSWEWPLEQGEGDAKTLNNTYDTIIGYKSYGRPWADVVTDGVVTNYGISKYVGSLKDTEYTDDNIITTIAFDINVTIEQIQ